MFARRRRRCVQYVVLALLAGMVPMAALMWLSYQRTLRRSEESLDRLVNAGVKRFENVLGAATQVLMRLAELTHGRMDDQTAELLRKTAYNSPYFREIGLVDEQGNLVCTSLGPTVPPMAVHPNPMLDYSSHRVQIGGLVNTVLMKESSIVVSLPMAGRGEINVLINPSVLTELFDVIPLGPDGYVVFALPDGKILASYGGASPTADPRIETESRGVRIERQTPQFNVTVLGRMSNAWALREWNEELAVIIPIGLICSSALAFLVLRLSRRSRGMKDELQLALRNGEFEAHYQPTMDLNTGKCIGAEALIRWKHPEQGYVRPDLFIAAAEESGQIDPITQWLMVQIVRDLGEVLQKRPDIHIGINLAPQQFASDWLMATLRDTYRDGFVPPRQIILEATERSMIDSGEGKNGDASAIIGRMRDMGFGVALDDFGTGYSSLGYLHKFKFDYLKIDASFVKRIGTDNVSAGVIDAIIDMGHTMKLDIIAEGVETEPQREFLAKRGVGFAQGWLFAKAMPATEFREFLRAN